VGSEETEKRIIAALISPRVIAIAGSVGSEARFNLLDVKCIFG
jgi:hypothetical protein